MLQRRRTCATVYRLSPYFLYGELIKHNVGVEGYHTSVFEGAEYELLSECLLQSFGWKLQQSAHRSPSQQPGLSANEEG